MVPVQEIASFCLGYLGQRSCAELGNLRIRLCKSKLQRVLSVFRIDWNGVPRCIFSVEWLEGEERVYLTEVIGGDWVKEFLPECEASRLP